VWQSHADTALASAETASAVTAAGAAGSIAGEMLDPCT